MTTLHLQFGLRPSHPLLRRVVLPPLLPKNTLMTQPQILITHLLPSTPIRLANANWDLPRSVNQRLPRNANRRLPKSKNWWLTRNVNRRLPRSAGWISIRASWTALALNHSSARRIWVHPLFCIRTRFLM
ncbi:hypothetical protein BCR41DRAFT_347799 [Lobosporangium transversale]|uniref:Uncharacterized protein n=1 Tax=Lobosporangium transversale TaxID=64571 RepID=A0A1Y2GY65_9FUNG|nr:hypothetical protein BCR41DRAFT_347799 [Lobosporangium transversale]ORZ26711.1 hypothetical protein BCR41DRAFT_347799 [Lobosporangium transversale]|eukprot:XP_021884474.1 hypothetical protein BCR41DRAFT_347799 [Lobosporangium transversale]